MLVNWQKKAIAEGYLLREQLHVDFQGRLYFQLRPLQYQDFHASAAPVVEDENNSHW